MYVMFTGAIRMFKPDAPDDAERKEQKRAEFQDFKKIAEEALKTGKETASSTQFKSAIGALKQCLSRSPNDKAVKSMLLEARVNVVDPNPKPDPDVRRRWV